MSSALTITLSGLNNAATRVGNAALNIVNASSTSKLPQSDEKYTGFTPQDIVSLSNTSSSGSPLGVTETSSPVIPAYTASYDPNNAQANSQGLVAEPNVDLTSQIVSLKESQVSYSANATALKIERKEEDALLDIKT